MVSHLKGLFNNLSTGKNARQIDNSIVPFEFNKQFLDEKNEVIVDLAEDDSELYAELNTIKKEMENGEYYTEDQIDWDN